MQGEHDAAPAAEKVPEGQAEQAMTPSGEYVFTAQLVVARVAVQLLPAGHGRQEDWPVTEMYVPSRQVSQEDFPLVEYFPVGQTVLAPTSQKEPSGQDMHDAALAAEKVPEGQAEQAMTPSGE